MFFKDKYLKISSDKSSSKILLVEYRRKSFLHSIVTCDEKWIYLENFKQKTHIFIPTNRLIQQQD